MMIIVGLGLLMKYNLIPGNQRWIKYGRNVDLYLFGLDRHQWGTIHLILGYILIGLLVLHLILHWKVIMRMYRQLIQKIQLRRKYGFKMSDVEKVIVEYQILKK